MKATIKDLEAEGKIVVVVERPSLRRVAAMIAMGALAAVGVINYANNQFKQSLHEGVSEASQTAQDNMTQAARIGNCLLGNSRYVSAAAIAQANDKASALLDQKVAQPLKGATDPLIVISESVSTTTTSTEAPTTVMPPQPDGEVAAAPPPSTEPTTTLVIPDKLPDCGAPKPAG